VDLFRERVFLRSEEEGSRFLTLVELAGELIPDSKTAGRQDGKTARELRG